MGYQAENRKSDEITLEDVEMAIKILTKFMDKYREAERVLSRLSSLQNRGGSLEERLAQMIVASRQGNNAVPSNDVQPPVEQELTEEEKQRIEELKKRYLIK